MFFTRVSFNAVFTEQFLVYLLCKLVKLRSKLFTSMIIIFGASQISSAENRSQCESEDIFSLNDCEQVHVSHKRINHKGTNHKGTCFEDS